MLGSPRDRSHLRFHVAQAQRRLALVDRRAFEGDLRGNIENALRNMATALTEYTQNGKAFNSEKLEAALKEAEDLIDKALHYPFDSIPLVTEYHNSVQRQRRAFIAEKGQAHPAVASPFAAEATTAIHECRPFLHDDPTRDIDAPGGLCLTPTFTDEVVRWWLEDHPPPRVCFATKTLIALTLFNPLPMPVECICDLCNAPCHVCWHAVDDLSNRSFDFNVGSISLDACLPCAVHYLQQGSDELRQFLNSPIPAVALPGDTAVSVVDGFASRQLIRDLAPSVRCRLLHGYREPSEVVFSIGVAPRGSHPVAWIADDGAEAIAPEIGDHNLLTHLNAAIAASTGIVDILFGVTLERQQSELGGMGPRAPSQLLGCCTICLEELHPSNGDCSQTRCNHWFHDRCLQQLRRAAAAKNIQFICPLCRSNDEALDNQHPNDIAKSNVYSVVVDLDKLRARQTAVASGGKAVLVVADICSIDGKILTAADIGAAVKIQFDTA